jgi:hypothetical protein
MAAQAFVYGADESIRRIRVVRHSRNPIRSACEIRQLRDPGMFESTVEPNGEPIRAYTTMTTFPRAWPSSR